MKRKVSVIKFSKDSLGILLPKVFCEILEIEKGGKLELKLEIDNKSDSKIIITKLKGEQLDEK